MCVTNHLCDPMSLKLFLFCFLCAWIKKFLSRISFCSLKIDFLLLFSLSLTCSTTHILNWMLVMLFVVYFSATAINAHKIFLFFYYDYIHVKWISFLSFPLLLHTNSVVLTFIIYAIYDFLFLIATSSSYFFLTGCYRSWQKEFYFIFFPRFLLGSFQKNFFFLFLTLCIYTAEISYIFFFFEKYYAHAYWSRKIRGIKSLMDNKNSRLVTCCYMSPTSVHT